MTRVKSRLLTLVLWLQPGVAMLAVTALAAALSTQPSFEAGSAAEPVDAEVALSPNDEGLPERHFNLRRAGLEIGSAMAVGLAWYQWQIELNERDFDFDRTWHDQWRRLTGAGYRLDDNVISLNVGHAFMGTIYHQFARANGGSAAQAMLFDFVTSSTWEFAVEHREVFSINDTIVTSAGGVALGESLFQLGDYFARSEPTFANLALMTLVSPGRALAYWLGDRPTTRPTPGAFGFAGDAAHRFALTAGGAHVTISAAAGGGSSAWQSDLGLDVDLVNIASYGHEANTRRTLHGGEFTHTEVERIGGQDGASHIALSSRATLWGLYRQNTTTTDAGADAPERVRGAATFIGSATAFDVASDDLGRTTDFVASVHLPGPAVDATLFRDRLTLRATADVYPDFTMVRPWALRDLPTGAAREGMKSTLVDNDYYYAFGMTSAARFEAAFLRARAGVDVAFSHFDSIEGLDRHQIAYTNPNGIYHGAVTRDDDLTDQRFKPRVYSESPLPASNVRLGVSLDYQSRRGTAPDVVRSNDDVRFGIHAAYAL